MVVILTSALVSSLMSASPGEAVIPAVVPQMGRLAAGGAHTCALLADRTVRCWGSNNSGQLGDGLTATSITPVTVQRVGGGGMLSDVTAIAVGGNHSCALLAAGTVSCWGRNMAGHLGQGGTPTALSATPVTVVASNAGGTLSGATAISAGGSHTCALLVAGTVKCWGANSSGALGKGGPATSYSTSPVTVVTGSGSGMLSGVTSIAAGYDHTCALLIAGTVKCWGRNRFGQLGEGGVPSILSTRPVYVVASSGSGVLSGAIAITAGGNHSCALLAAGTVTCWGSNRSGELGKGGVITGVNDYSTRPVTVVSGSGSGMLDGVIAITAGHDHACALLGTGTVRCWGDNRFGQLGKGPVVAPALSTKPVTVVAGSSGGTLSNARAVTGGWEHSCALLAAGTVKCWGYNAVGQLGHSTPTSISGAPVVVTGL